MSVTDERRARLEGLWHAHADRVLGFAWRRAGEDAAREVVAETFTVAWRRLDEVPAEPLPWLLGVARHLIANRRRGERRRRALHLRLGALPPEYVADPADRAGESEAVRAAFAAISADDRETLMLVAWDGLTPAQAALVVGCTPRAFSTRLSRARARLAERLDADAPVLTTPTGSEA